MTTATIKSSVANPVPVESNPIEFLGDLASHAVDTAGMGVLTAAVDPKSNLGKVVSQWISPEIRDAVKQSLERQGAGSVLGTGLGTFGPMLIPGVGAAKVATKGAQLAGKALSAVLKGAAKGAALGGGLTAAANVAAGHDLSPETITRNVGLTSALGGGLGGLGAGIGRAVSRMDPSKAAEGLANWSGRQGIANAVPGLSKGALLEEMARSGMKPKEIEDYLRKAYSKGLTNDDIIQVGHSAWEKAANAANSRVRNGLKGLQPTEIVQGLKSTPDPLRVKLPDPNNKGKFIYGSTLKSSMPGSAYRQILDAAAKNPKAKYIDKLTEDLEAFSKMEAPLADVREHLKKLEADLDKEYQQIIDVKTGAGYPAAEERFYQSLNQKALREFMDDYDTVLMEKYGNPEMKNQWAMTKMMERNKPRSEQMGSAQSGSGTAGRSGFGILQMALGDAMTAGKTLAQRGVGKTVGLGARPALLRQGEQLPSAIAGPARPATPTGLGKAVNYAASLARPTEAGTPLAAGYNVGRLGSLGAAQGGTMGTIGGGVESDLSGTGGEPPARAQAAPGGAMSMKDFAQMSPRTLAQVAAQSATEPAAQTVFQRNLAIGAKKMYDMKYNMAYSNMDDPANVRRLSEWMDGINDAIRRPDGSIDSMLAARVLFPGDESSQKDYYDSLMTIQKVNAVSGKAAGLPALGPFAGIGKALNPVEAANYNTLRNIISEATGGDQAILAKLDQDWTNPLLTQAQKMQTIEDILNKGRMMRGMNLVRQMHGSEAP